MTDMRNVNNWHWVNKDCRMWSKKYLTQKVVGLSTNKNNTQASITSLDECIGDVDLNQRKGKLLAMYDVALKLGWQGQTSNGNKLFGTISIPEVAYDTEWDDYVFNISVNNALGKGDELKRLIRQDLTPLLRDIFSHFTHDLIQNYSSDLYADKNSVPITPTLAQRKSTFTPSEKKNEREVVKTTIVEHSYDFQGTSSRDIYEALLDPKRADIWTRSKSKVSKKIGTDFEFFDGNVHGVLLQATPGKSIKQTWRLKIWPKDHFSIVTLDFQETEDGTTVKVNQIGVPVGQEEVIRRNWTGYYWNAIKDHLGQLQCIPYQSDPVFGLFDSKHMIVLGALVAFFVIALTAYLVAPSLKF